MHKISMSRLVLINEIHSCPFCGSETFKVNDEVGLFKCFGCLNGGDAVSLYRKLFGLSTSEALEVLSSLNL